MLPVRIARLRGGRPHNSFCSVRLLGCHSTLTRPAEFPVQLIFKQTSTDGSINDHLWRTGMKNLPNLMKILAAKCHEIRMVGYPISIHCLTHSAVCLTTRP